MKTSPHRTFRVVGIALLLTSTYSPLHTARLEHPKENVLSDTSGVEVSPSKTSAAYHKLSLSFEENRGQVDERVKYLSRAPGYSLFLTGTEAIIKLRRNQTDQKHVDRLRKQNSGSNPQLVSVRFRLLGSNTAAAIKGVDELPCKTNYFIGNDPRKWRTSVPAYARVICRGVYAGVDLVYHGNQRQLEYDLIVAPGANPEVIRLGFEGANNVRIDAQGNLVLETGTGSILQHRPRVYQEENGGRQELPAGYVIGRGHEVSFEIGEYDTSKPLVIDPVLSYSTYLGGSDDDEASGIAVDSDGNTYVTGTTASMGFPTVGGFQSGRSADFINSDVFIAKLNSAGTALLYSTYLGGVGNDEAYGIAVDSAGSAYVTGETYSRDFPTSDGAFQRKNAGADDAFVAKLNPGGDALVYSTYLGGETAVPPVYYSPNTGSDTAFSIAVDSDGNAYVTGRTYSSDFPTKRPLQATINGGSIVKKTSQPPPLPVIFSDAFVTKLNPSGKDLVYSTFLGGAGNEEGRGIAIDASGSAYVVGFASSGAAGSSNSLQPVFGGGSSDAFVVRLAPTGRTMVFSTWLGGSGSDKAYGVALDGSGNCYVTGETDSANFPTTTSAFRTKLSGAPIFKSTDGGTTWNSSATGLPPITVDHLKIDPSTAKTVYAGFIGRYPTPGGIFKSTDGGASWSAANAGLPGAPNFSIGSLAVDSKNPDTLYVVSSGNVFKSTDGSGSWSAPGSKAPYVTGPLLIDPIQSNTLYAGTNVCPVPGSVRGAERSGATTNGPPTESAAAQDFPPGPRALFKSTDGGATWNPTAFPSCAIGWLVIDSRNPATLYSGFSSILKSTDGGNNWSRRIPDVFATVLAVDPADSSTLYATQGSNQESKLLKSTDGGETWKEVGFLSVGINDFAIDPSNPSTIYAGTGNLAFGASYDYFNPIPLFGFGGGVFKSTDSGATWKVTSLDGVAVKQLAISPSNPSTLYAGAFQGSDAFVTKIDPTGSAIIYSTYLGGAGRDAGLAVTADAAGNAYITGQTYSGDFPTREAIQARRASGPSASGAFVAKLTGQGQALIYSTHLGGSGDSSGNGDVGRAIAVDPFGKVYVAGVTGSNDFPIRTSIQRESGGEEDAFVARIVLPPKIIGASISGKNLVLAGESFDKHAVILLDGEEHSARNDAANPSGLLIGKKLAKKIAPGQTVKLRVRNSDGEISEEFLFVRSAG